MDAQSLQALCAARVDGGPELLASLLFDLGKGSLRRVVGLEVLGGTKGYRG